ncbi:hypothetical protein ACSTH7_24750 [Vibrio parahaemolyticus]|uniref:hypothetical protein n=2 Tax=Vibrio parahaemolyticus TaxID=670 RepID=UPI00111CA25B|nr:hypothetical protein [Vibrio parahaemolyticus]EGR2894978.1 hypothetical protein [Vibrio parahaemolyticus]EGR2933642.1 hypothetical protein [Vibrio parahaemolyticus]EGR2958093.1 hypothetical protein [Vibrio parahaemolyticus]EGR2963014.1 hypothetical protein [Vibrio parahaemolyticus]EGR2967952.1 hypothetical protein [Vibrio parahaemolyticus]
MKGCALFQFIYPGNIRILPGEAFFDFQGDRFCISVSPHLNAVNTLSVNDKIVRVPAENSKGFKYAFDAPRYAADNQICNYVENQDGFLDVSLMMDTDGKGHTQLSSSSTVTHVRIALESNQLCYETELKAIGALNHFIRVYRYATLDTSIKETAYMTGFKPFIYAGFKPYTEQHLEKITDQRIHELFNDWVADATRFSSMQPRNLSDAEFGNINRNEVTGHVAYYLNSGDFPSWRITLIRAYEMANEQENYSAAVLESFIALEVALFNMLNLLRTHGRQIKKYKKIFDVIEKALPELFGDEVSELVVKLNQFRTVRNNIVHNGYVPTEEECSVCLSVADEAFKFIDTKI